MSRLVRFVSSLVLVALVASAVPVQAASQPFFEGYWRCANGNTLNVTSAFGPWLNYKSTGSGNTAQAFLSRDNVGGGWANVGVDSAGGFWTMTSSGWNGSQLTFTGTYTFAGKGLSQRQVITRNADRAMTVQTWRNGSLVGQLGCNK